jgi:putative ABC transport system permease protein
LVLGAVVLVVMNIFSTRERKYEIGVMSAIGMKKHQLAMLFVTEILMITLIGSVIGGGVGAAVSVPVTNALLTTQTATGMGGRGGSFGRDMDRGPGQGPNNGGGDTNQTQNPSQNGSTGQSGQRITEVKSAVNLTVLIELLGISLLLAMASGMVSVITITRYDPIKILSERD